MMIETVSEPIAAPHANISRSARTPYSKGLILGRQVLQLGNAHLAWSSEPPATRCVPLNGHF